MSSSMRTVKASEFKATCLKLMDEVASTGDEIVITKNGKAISKLVPYQDPRTTLFGRHAKLLDVQGDLLAPIGEAWDCE